MKSLTRRRMYAIALVVSVLGALFSAGGVMMAFDFESNLDMAIYLLATVFCLGLAVFFLVKFVD